MSALSSLYMHTVTVSTYLGSTFTGDSYAAPVDVAGFLDDGVIVQEASGAAQQLAKTTFFTSIDNAALFAPESKVTANGHDMQVDQIRRRDGGGMLAPVTHLEVDLS